MAIFSGARYINRRLAGQGAFILANPAADTQLVNDIRLLHADHPPSIAHHIDILESNGLNRGQCSSQTMQGIPLA